jgi:single-strand DNA-binding protein
VGFALARKRAAERSAYYVGAGVESGGHDRCPGSSRNPQGRFNNEKDIQKGENSSMSVNRVILIGRVGKDPEVRYTASGTPVCRFSLATNERFKDKAGERQEHTEWHSIVAWGRLAEICGQYLAKAKLVYIEGAVRTRKWDDKDGKERKSFDIVANQMTMLSSSSGDGTKTKAESAKPAPPTGASQTTAQPSYEDNPFEADPSDVPF